MTATAGAALSCRDVAVTIGDAIVLRDLDLQVPAGALTAVVGPSGAGKTTLLRTIAGLEPISRGTIRLGPRDLAGVASHERRLAVVFQEPRLFPNLSVGDNVAFPLRMTGTARRERRRLASSLLDDVGLAGTAHRDPRSLSGGEQQRVALARALAGDPDLLLLDEPLSAVDPERREEVRQLIARLQRQRSVTTLYVTHDRAEAAELGDQLALMVEGRVIQQAPPEDLFNRPATAVVARFFGASNILRGTVVSGRLEVAGFRLPCDAPDGPITVAVRPERLELDADGPLRGTVEAVSYQGTHRRLVIACGTARLEAHVDPATSVAPGERVGLRVAARHLWPVADATDAALDRRRLEAS